MSLNCLMSALHLVNGYTWELGNNERRAEWGQGAAVEQGRATGRESRRTARKNGSSNVCNSGQSGDLISAEAAHASAVKGSRGKQIEGVAYHISQSGRNNWIQAGKRGGGAKCTSPAEASQIGQTGACACTRPHSAHTAGLVRCLLWCLWPDSAAPLWKVRWQSWQCHWGGGSTCRRKQRGRGQGRGLSVRPISTSLL